MLKKYLLQRLIVLCLTIMAGLWLIRGSLCEVRITYGSNEYAAFLNYEVKR